MFKIDLPTQTVEVGAISYVTFNKRNHLPYLTEDPTAPALVYDDTIYLIRGVESERIPEDHSYEYCSIKEVPDSVSLLKVESDVKDLQEQANAQDEQNLIIMGAIADLYDQLASIQK